MTRKVGFLCLAVAVGILFFASSALAQVCPGDTVDERAVNCAKEYIQKKGLEDITQTHLLISLFAKGQPKLDKRWKELTGVNMQNIEYGYTEIPSKIMAEAVAKTGKYDIFNHFAHMVPDGFESGVITSMDEWAERGKPDFSDIAPALRAQQFYKGHLVWLFMDGDHAVLAVRKDLISLPKARDAFFEKFGWYPRCPSTWQEWYQLASFFRGEKGENFYGKELEKDLYGAQEYRSRNFAYRWWQGRFISKGKLLFDENMNPQVNGPEGWEATEEFLAITEFMPKDILGWATPQNYPFFAQGNSFSISTFPSIVGYANGHPKSLIRGDAWSCPIPGSVVEGKLKRVSTQTAGTGYYVSSYGKHPELAYWFLQWMTSPEIGNQAVADVDGFWDPFRMSQLDDPAIQKKFSKQFLHVTLANAECAVPMLMIPGNREYFNAVDVRLGEALQGMTSAKEAMRRLEEDWQRITDDIGRDRQKKAWQSLVDSGAYDTPNCKGWVPQAELPVEDY